MNLRHLQQCQIARSCSKLWNRWNRTVDIIFNNTDNYDINSSLLGPKNIIQYKGNEIIMLWNTKKSYMYHKISHKNIYLHKYLSVVLLWKKTSLWIMHRSPLPYEISSNILIFSMVADFFKNSVYPQFHHVEMKWEKFSSWIYILHMCDSHAYPIILSKKKNVTRKEWNQKKFVFNATWIWFICE